jgi:uncharacterized protein YndB with AHSA1/START domain
MDSGRCELRITRRYEATPGEVWRALTEPASLARWLAAPVDVELAPGGAFELALPSDGRIDARVRQIQPERLLELDWQHPGEQRSVVRFELHGQDGGTVLTLDHGRIEAPLGMAYISRWGRMLDRFDAEVAR